jgi:large repetitive protein
MTSFGRWLHSLGWVFVFAALTMSCQVLFGDFKVRDRGGEGGQGAGTGNPGNPEGSTSGMQTTGPLRVVPTSDLYTSDLGAQARFYVSLAHQPKNTVTVPIVSANANEGTASPVNLFFTVEDWNAPQAVTVTGVHDPRSGNQPYSVLVGPAVSDDKEFDTAKATVSLVNIDNDNAGFFVTPTQGLETSESGGQAFFTVVLNKRPEADVTVTLSVVPSSSGENAGAVAPSSLTFTADNWSAPQTVAVTGLNDEIVGENIAYQVTVGPLTSQDGAFAQLPSQTVSVTNLDNDRAGVMVTLSSGIDPSDTKRLRTSESGDMATFTVALNMPPKQDVTLEVSSNSEEGKATPPKLTFTAMNWNAPQIVTVAGLDNDSAADGNQPYQIKLGPVTSQDPAYGQLTENDLLPVNVINVDNDKADFAVTLRTGLDPNNASQLQTTEKGSKASFSVVLTSKPQSPVHFDVTSTRSEEGTISPGALDFTEGNWFEAQTITVTGVDDDTKDGNAVYAVRISAPTTEDPAYQKLQSTDVKVVNLDDEVAGLTPPKLLTGIDGGTKLVTKESGTTATFSISLTSRPKKDVKVPVMSGDGTEGKVAPATLTFTPANYDTAQTVTITGLDDPQVDGNQAYTVNIGPTTSDDTDYVGLTQSVKVTNQDDDTAYIVPTTYSGMTAEKGTSMTIGISLSTLPMVPVTLTFASSDMNEVKVMPSSLVFSTSNWSTLQNITVTGVNDDIADGDKSVSIAVKGTNTTDQQYMYAATTLTVVNKDDDVASVKVTAAANLQTTEAGGKVTFTVALTSQPTANVSIAVTSSVTKEGTVSPASLSFTASNWSVAQTVTVTGVDDSIADGNQSYTVTLKNSGNDAKYTALTPIMISIVNKDDDPVGITVTPTTCATTPGTTATFSVVLKSQPLGAVSIALSSDTPTEGKVSPAMLSFTAMNWSTAQMVTVTGVDDLTMGMMTPYKIVTAAAVSAMDSNYNGLNAADVACINTTPAAPTPDP